jgi:hypothetical protein
MTHATEENLALLGHLNQPTAAPSVLGISRRPTETAGRGSAHLALWIGAVAPTPRIEPTAEVLPPALGPGLGLAASYFTGSARTALARYELETSRVRNTFFGDLCVAYLAVIRSLLERDEVAAARKVLDAVPPDASDEPEMRRLKRLLAPPRVTVNDVRDVDRTREYRWLREHWQEYRDQWIAVDGDTVLASARSLEELREILRELSMTRPPLVHRIS